MFSHLRILYHFWICLISSYLKEPPCTFRTHTVETIQHYTLWRNTNKYECLVRYNFRSTQGRPTNLHPNERHTFSPFRISYHFLIWPISSYIKEPPCTQSTPSSCRCSQWEQINTIHCEEIKINMNVWLDITSAFFKGGRQIYIQMKAYVLPL